MKKKSIPAVNTVGFYVSLIIVFAIVAAIKHFFPEAIPFEMFEFFKFSFSWEKLSGIPWILLLFGPVLTLIVTIVTKNKRSENDEIRDGIGKNLWTSIKAGVFEEASFRWLSFYFLIICFTFRDVIINWLMNFTWISSLMTLPVWTLILILVIINIIGFFAFALIKSDVGNGWMTIALIVIVLVIIIDLAAGLGIIKWWYTAVMLPVINFVTMGKMSTQLFGYSWMVGAALVSSNWNFGEGHTYQGCLGWLNSWIIGMLMFWFTFNFGLLFAMTIHAIYDIVIDLIRYFDANIELISTK